MKNIFLVIILMSLLQQKPLAQALTLTNILDSIEQSHPSMKMYDAEIHASDEAAKGAKTWAAPEISTGFWMTPYNVNLWSKDGPSNTGMGQYMISASQTLPNKKYNEANEKYMQGMSSVEKENKKASLNELFSTAKSNYDSWIIIEKKINLLEENEKLLQLMITNAGTRYKNGLGKISAYYKAKAALANLGASRIALANEALQKKIVINTLMNRNKLTDFIIDTNYTVKDYGAKSFDSSMFYASRSDIRAIDKNIQLNYLRQEVEKESLQPQFGVQFAHMFGFGGFPEQFTLMGTMKIPFASWASRASKANIESLKWKVISMESEKQVMVNEYSGIAYGLQRDMISKQKQLQLFEQSIIPALRKNYQSTLLAYEQNTEELFTLYDAWETLNNTQLVYLDTLQQLLTLQVELEKVLEIK
jgi:outer membrane protein, heavy metal efflux system